MAAGLNRSDKKLVAGLAFIAAVSLAALMVGGRWAERMVLESESDLKSARAVQFLRQGLPELAGAVIRGQVTPEDRALLRNTSLAGEAFRYKLYDAQGRVVVASRPGDIGKRATRDFAEILQEGRSVFRIERRGPGVRDAESQDLPYSENARVVGVRFEPIIRDSRVLGAIEVCLDMTPLDDRLRANSRRFLAGLLAVFALVGAACTASVYQNLQQRNQAMEEIASARLQAKRLGDEATVMFEGLFRAEEEQMSRVVGMVDGIAHKLGNPLSTITMSLDALEASLLEVDREQSRRRIADMQNALDRIGAVLHERSAVSIEEEPLAHKLGNPLSTITMSLDVLEASLLDVDREESRRRIADMQNALDRVGAVLHELSTVWIEEEKLDQKIDVNQSIRSLAGLVQLNDRLCSSPFTLDLSPYLIPLALPRRSLSLSLFLVLTAVAESMQHARGSPRVETRMSGGGEGVEVRVEAVSSPSAGSPTGALSPPRFELDDSPLDTARRLLRSIGGRMAVLRKSGRGISCLISLPLRAAQHPEGRAVPRRQRSSQPAVTPRTPTPPPFGGVP